MQRGQRQQPGGGGAPAANQGRQNEYFVPREGIDREVITADICRYLGNDALVRPGIYHDDKSGRDMQGYFINAYRNLTSAMIADLKADSARWEAERRKHQSGAVRYQDSLIRDPTRYAGQYRDNTRDAYDNMSTPKYPGNDHPGYSAAQPSGGYGAQPSAAAGYAPSGYGQPSYAPGYATQSQPAAGYSQTPGHPGYGTAPMAAPAMDYSTTGNWNPGADLRAGAAPMQNAYSTDTTMSDAPPRPGVSYAPGQAPPYQSQPSYPSQQGYPSWPPSSNTGYPSQPLQPIDAFNGRGPGGFPASTPASQQTLSDTVSSPKGGNTNTGYSPATDPQYDAVPATRSSGTPSGTQQAQIPPSANANPRHNRNERDRERERERERDRDDRPDKRHHHYGRR